MPLNAPEFTSLIFATSAEGVRGGVRSSSESVVVCDLRSVVEALIASSGFGSSFAVVCGCEGVPSEGASEDWKCVRRFCVVFATSMRALMSFGFAMSSLTNPNFGQDVAGYG
jgi:hypothetical protein